MLTRVILLLCLAVPLRAASGVVDHDPELVKTRPLVTANQELSLAMTLADVMAARAINAGLSPAQLARWKRLQGEQPAAAAGERRRTIFDFARQLDLTPLQIESIRNQIVSLKALLEQNRAKIAVNQATIRDLHPDLGMSELGALPRPAVLLERSAEIGLSRNQLAFVQQVNDRLRAITAECRRRIVANAQALRPLLANDAALERVGPFIRADGEMLTELTLAGLRASLELHEHVNPAQRAQWHELGK